MEANHHLSNKYALFYNMNQYYSSIGRDPFEVLPLTFHIGKGIYDPSFVKFQEAFKETEIEAKNKEAEEKKAFDLHL